MKRPSELTNHALVREHQRLNVRWDKILNRLIAAGLGDKRPIELRAMAEPPKVVRDWIVCMDAMHDLRSEADRRYGPGLVTVSQLTWKVS